MCGARPIRSFPWRSLSERSTAPYLARRKQLPLNLREYFDYLRGGLGPQVSCTLFVSCRTVEHVSQERCLRFPLGATSEGQRGSNPTCERTRVVMLEILLSPRPELSRVPGRVSTAKLFDDPVAFCVTIDYDPRPVTVALLKMSKAE